MLKFIIHEVHINFGMGYEVLEHTADLRLRVWGKNKGELFSEALRALGELMRPKSKIPGLAKRSGAGKNQKSKLKRIKIKSIDTTALLIDFLNEALTLSHENKEIYNKVSFKKLTETELEAALSGSPVKEFEEDIKAVTYHEAEIIKNKKGDYETFLVFDI